MQNSLLIIQKEGPPVIVDAPVAGEKLGMTPDFLSGSIGVVELHAVPAGRDRTAMSSAAYRKSGYGRSNHTAGPKVWVGGWVAPAQAGMSAARELIRQLASEHSAWR